MIDLLIGIMLGIFLALVPCLLLLPEKNRIMIQESLFRKPYGRVEVICKGREIITFVEDFTKDTFVNGVRRYILFDKGIWKKNGIKTITLREKDIMPVDMEGDFKNLPKKDQKKLVKDNIEKGLNLETQPAFSVDSAMLNAIFMKQKTVSEAEAIGDIKQIRLMVIGAMIGTFICAALSFGIFDKLTNYFEPAAEFVKTGITALRAKVGA